MKAMATLFALPVLALALVMGSAKASESESVHVRRIAYEMSVSPTDVHGIAPVFYDIAPNGSSWITLRCGAVGFEKTSCAAPEGYFIQSILRPNQVEENCKSVDGVKSWGWDRDGIWVRNRCELNLRALLVPIGY